MTALSTAPVEEILRWVWGDPQPADLTECHDGDGALWACGRMSGLWHYDGPDVELFGLVLSWNQLTLRSPVTRYRPVSDEQYAAIVQAGQAAGS